MSLITDHILSWITFLPLIGAVVIIFLPKGKDELVKWVSAIFTFIPLILAIYIFATFQRNFEGGWFQNFQYTEGPYKWIPSFNITYLMGIDGLSAPMVILTALLCFLCIFASWGINKGVKAYFALFLLLDTGMMGVFCALDFFLFYVFWEVMLLPMYFLIGIWGGPRKEYAAIKFFLYTLLGSVLMLLAMLALYFYEGNHTFDIRVLIKNASTYTMTFQFFVWWALAIGFAIKVPVFPFHTWLPDAHVEAPTAISVILAGILLKMGTYGFLRFNFPMLPNYTREIAWLIALFGLINIIYGALCAMAQRDLKKLVAYSSISHMGYCLLGMASFTPQGINGAVLQMFNHGTVTAMLFLLVGVIYDRAHHREIDGFGGLASIMPVYTGFTALAYFAALGLPGLSSFISEVLVFIGAFQKYPFIVIISGTGIILTAAYLLWVIQRMFLGETNQKYIGLPEINGREIFTLAPLGIIVIILGVYPHPVLDLMKATVSTLSNYFK